MVLIDVTNLSYRYKDGTQALNRLSLTISQGRKTAILGPNGAGKSTLLLHLNGILLAQEGQVSFAGEIISAKNEHWVRSKVGLVFQDPDDQVFSTTVWEDVAFGPTNMGLRQDEINERVAKALAAVGMSKYEKKAPYNLSYGQKKRVAIAGVLAMNPEVIILDEPGAFLDPRGEDDLYEILDELNKQGTTIIIATHDTDLAVEWADDLIVIRDGQCLGQGGPEILADESIIEKANLRFPVVTRIFNQIPELGLEKKPQTIGDAVTLISDLIKARSVKNESL
ncbi:MAG: ATP-binding cassette domain-containing protein [Bacillota bacterium]